MASINHSTLEGGSMQNTKENELWSSRITQNESCVSILRNNSSAFGCWAPPRFWLLAYSEFDRMSRSSQRVKSEQNCISVPLIQKTLEGFYISWKALASHRRSWRSRLGRRTSGVPWLPCCQYNLGLASCQKMDGL